MNFFKESVEELRKVTWPTKDQAVKLTIITIIFTILATLLLAVSDFGFKKGYEYMLKTSPKVQNQQADLTQDNVVTPDVEISTATDSEGNAVDVEVVQPESTEESSTETAE